jgi:hypothetical protein
MIMKKRWFKKVWIFLFALSSMASAQDDNTVREGVVVLPVERSVKPVPTFFSANADVQARRFFDRIETVSTIVYELHQGTGERMSLSLNGEGEITEVTGEGMKDWSLRRDATGQRFLDLRVEGSDAKRKQWTIQVRTRHAMSAGIKSCELWLPGQGDAVGYTMQVALLDEGMRQARVIAVEHLSPVEESKGLKFVGSVRPKLTLDISQSEGEISFRNARLSGRVAADQKSVEFAFAATALVRRAGASIKFCNASAALGDVSAGDGWHMSLRSEGDAVVYDWIAEREGEVAVNFVFNVPVSHMGDWRMLDFTIPAGVVVPLWLEGLTSVEFDAKKPVVPVRSEEKWRGFLPADGRALLGWRASRQVADGALFFSSTEISDLRVGSGLLRQVSQFDLRVLQGKLPALELQLHGVGEVLSVRGEQLVGWKLREEGGKRLLALQWSRAIEGTARVIIESQAPLGDFPLKTSGLRYEPIGSLRHSGWLRIANEGAVKIEVPSASGLIQLAPEQFPAQNKNLRQAFVYRFPSVDYAYQVGADHVLPETSVHELTVYELAESDRRIIADIEMDIREAPLREWEILVPEDYTVVSCTGAAVADYSLATTANDGRRALKILFREAVRDRQLLQLRLEKNEAAKAGGWVLMPLRFPGVKSQRGFIGVTAAAGYRMSGGERSSLSEVPLSYFPKQTSGLQQAYRIKDSNWQATMNAEALGQSVQADVFHLYSVKEGAVYGSVLFNYFVVGAPASEWRVEIPESIGNIDITGQNIGHEWRREGNFLIVPLSRPLLGAGTMLLSFEQPIAAAGGEIFPGEIRPLNVQTESGYVQVVSPLQVDFKVTKNTGNVLPLQANELPADYRVLSNAPTLSAWQYTARDFSIGLAFQWFKTGETVEQVVDFVKLASQVSRDGQLVTEARFFVKSKRLEALRMSLPEGSILLETKVNGDTANPRVDKGEIVVPLPQKNDLNQAVEVLLRYGAAASKGRKVSLQAPVLQAPTVIGEWTVTGDEGRVLTPIDGTVEVVSAPMWQNGFQWLNRNGSLGLVFVGFLALAWIFSRSQRLSGITLLAAAVVAMVLANASVGTVDRTPTVLGYAAPVVKAGARMVVEISNAPRWAAALAPAFWMGVVLGLISIGRGLWKKDRWWTGGGLALVAMGLLSLRNGAPVFFLATGVMLLAMAIMKLLDGLRRPMPPVPATALLMMGCFFVMSAADAAEPLREKTAERLTYDCRIKEQRLYGTVAVDVRAEAGDRFGFLQAPAVLGEFTSEGLRVVRETRGDAAVYVMVADQAGTFRATAVFEMPLPQPQQPWQMPIALAVIRKLNIVWDQPGWEFTSAAAARTEVLSGITEKESGAILWLKPVAVVEIVSQARQRDPATEKSVFFVESSQLMMPLPGVVNGRHAIVIRPSQGLVKELLMKVPTGFTVSDVGEGPVGLWRFDPQKSELRVAIEPAQKNPFSLTVQTQRGAAALPVEMGLEPLRVQGCAGDVGLLALAFGDDAQPEKVTVNGMAAVNPDDFDASMLPTDANGQPLATLQQVYRFGAAQASLQARITPVAAEMRAESWHVLSLGDDRMLLSTDLVVSITRAGIFRLLLEIPKGLEIESASGAALSHWTEAESDDVRLLTLHLNGRTMGRQSFHLSFTGAATGAQKNWQVPRLILREATRVSGIITIVPEQGMRIGVIAREHASPMDPRDLSEAPPQHAKAAMRMGALAFRLLQKEWRLELSIDELEPWVTAQVFHEVVLREGQLGTKLGLVYQIENAAIKALRVRLPGLNEVTAGTVRATGASVADFVKIEGEADLWEIRFQRGVSGSTEVHLEFQQQLTEDRKQKIEPIQLVESRQTTYFAAIRSGGRMELSVDATLPEGWLPADWSAIQVAMPRLRHAVSPALSFKVTNANNALPIHFQRHQLADIRKMRVAQGTLTSLVSTRGEVLTAVHLNVQVAEKGTLRLRLPQGADLYNVLVNDEGASLVREGAEWLFYVFPAADEKKPATVRFVYAAAAGKSMELEGPLLSVPMENLNWRVLIPEGFRLRDHKGDFEIREQSKVGSFRLENYQDFVQARKESSSAEAVALFDQASQWINQGDQQKASIALGNATRNGLLDEASNEDARVQLRELRTQQAVLGLNTRRQKMFLDNKNESGQENRQLEEATQINPLLQGKSNYDPKQFDRFIDGNTADENAALQAIAQRIVNQQLAAEPAPSGLEISVPERGSVLTFGRSIQVDGGKPMRLQLDLERAEKTRYGIALLICALFVAVVVARRKAGV